MKTSSSETFVRMIFAEGFPLVQVQEQLIAEFGSPKIQSPLLPFTPTRYMPLEVRDRIGRKFVIFQS